MLWLLLLLVECALLSVVDRKLWKTYFTPLHFLMVPYLAVLLFTLCVAGRWGLDKFYYPSLIPWIAGLPLFAAGSYLVFFLARKINGKKGDVAVFGGSLFGNSGSARPEPGPIPFWLTLVLLVLLSAQFIYRLVKSDPSCGLGTDCFAATLTRNKLFSHLMVMLMALLIINIFDFDRRKKYYWFFIPLSVFLIVFLQIKSWIILPLLAGFLARILSGKNRLNLKSVSVISFTGIAFFFLSYLLMYVYGDHIFTQGTPFKEQLSSVGRLCIHYITSGTLGLSSDMAQGITEDLYIGHLFTPFVNFWHLVNGQEFVSSQNPEYLFTGLNYTNVRTLFGTIYVFCPVAFFCFMSFATGVAVYLIMAYASKAGTRGAGLLYVWICTLLFMGWFDPYIQLSSSWEIPFWMVVISMLDKRAGRMGGKSHA